MDYIKYKIISGKHSPEKYEIGYTGAYYHEVRIPKDFAARFAALWAEAMYRKYYSVNKYESSYFHATAAGGVYYVPMYCDIDVVAKKVSLRQEFKKLIVKQLGKDVLKNPEGFYKNYVVHNGFTELAFTRSVQKLIYDNVKKNPKWKLLRKLCAQRVEDNEQRKKGALKRLQNLAANKGYKLVKA